MTMNPEDLFKDLQVAAVVKKVYSEASLSGTTAIIYLESLTNPDLIACQVEIPWDKLATYGIHDDTQ
jgi:hypothetical protein